MVIVDKGRWTRKPLPTEKVEIDWSHPLSANLAACWLMHEAGGLRVTDIASKKYHGALINPAGRSAGPGGIGIDFNGTSTRVDTADIPFGGTAPVSIFSLFRPDSITGNRHLVAQGTEIVLRFVDANLEFILNSFTTNDRVSVAHSLTAGKLHSAAGSYGSSGLIRVYQDGKSLGSVTPTGAYADVASVFQLGALTGAEFFAGAMYCAMIWQRELSAAQMAWLHAEPYAFIRPVIRRTYFVAAGIPADPMAALAEIGLSFELVAGGGQNNHAFYADMGLTFEIPTETSIGRAISTETESLASVSKATGAPAESLASLTKSVLTSVEVLASLTKAVSTPAEALAALARTLETNAESLRAIAAQGVSPAESLASLAGTALTPSEALQSVADQKQAAAENLQGISSQIQTPAEFLGDAPVSRAIRTESESIASISVQRQVPAESLRAISAEKPSPAEHLQGNTRQVTTRAELLASVAAQRATISEYLAIVARVAQVPVESLLEVRRPIGTPAESLQGAELNLILSVIELTAYFAEEKSLEALCAREKTIETLF